MEIGGVSKTSSAASSSLAARQDLAAQTGAVKTELAGTQSVQQASATVQAAVSYNLREDALQTATRATALQSFIVTRNDYDVKTRETVFRAVNSRTGEVLRQFPDDISLKLRAFVRNIKETKETNDASESDVPHVTRIA